MRTAAVSIALMVVAVPGASATEGGDAVKYTQSCYSSDKDITSTSECKTAAKALGLNWKGAENDASWPHGCYEAENGEGKGVYYNTHSGSDVNGVDVICIDEESESSPLSTAIGVVISLCCCGGIAVGIWWRCCRQDKQPTSTAVAVPVRAPETAVVQAVPVIAPAVPVVAPAAAGVVACGSCSQQFQSPPGGGLVACPHCGTQVQMPATATATAVASSAV